MAGDWLVAARTSLPGALRRSKTTLRHALRELEIAVKGFC